jgi:hypothetical protein
MNKIILACIILLAGLGFWYWQNQSSQSSVIDCGVDTACFAANFKSCTLSKIYGGAIEVTAGNSDACKVKFHTGENTFLNQPALTMECVVKNTDSFRDEEINAATIYQKGSACEGSMADEYAKIPGLR